MGQPEIPIKTTRPLICKKENKKKTTRPLAILYVGRPMASQIGLGATGPGPRPAGPFPSWAPAFRAGKERGGGRLSGCEVAHDGVQPGAEAVLVGAESIAAAGWGLEQGGVDRRMRSPPAALPGRRGTATALLSGPALSGDGRGGGDGIDRVVTYCIIQLINLSL